jgi:hypothetical protein
MINRIPVDEAASEERKAALLSFPEHRLDQLKKPQQEERKLLQEKAAVEKKERDENKSSS